MQDVNIFRQKELIQTTPSALVVYFFILMTFVTIGIIFQIFALGSINNTTIAIGSYPSNKKLKIGIATSHCIFATISSGDHSIYEACRDADISYISSATTTTRGCWFFSTTTTTVYGK